jgi:hypothetical protein
VALAFLVSVTTAGVISQSKLYHALTHSISVLTTAAVFHKSSCPCSYSRRLAEAPMSWRAPCWWRWAVQHTPRCWLGTGGAVAVTPIVSCVQPSTRMCRERERCFDRIMDLVDHSVFGWTSLAPLPHTRNPHSYFTRRLTTCAACKPGIQLRPLAAGRIQNRVDNTHPIPQVPHDLTPSPSSQARAANPFPPRISTRQPPCAAVCCAHAACRACAARGPA